MSTARTKLLASLAAGVAAGTAAAVAGAGRAAPLIGWDILALVFGVWVWSTVWRLAGPVIPAELRSTCRQRWR